jgi:hypothetical protein
VTAPGGFLARTLLLIEPDGLVRGTVASVCRDLQIAQVRQEISIASAEQWLTTGAPQALLISLAEGDVALDFLTRLRAGAFSCNAGLPVVAMTRAVNAVLVTQIKTLDVRRLLLQPFKLHDVIHTLEQLWPAHEALPA